MRQFGYGWLSHKLRRSIGIPTRHHRNYPAGYPKEIEQFFFSNDQQRLFLRPIRSDDTQKLQESFSYLSPESIYRRFHSHLNSLSDESCYALTHVDYKSHLALVAMDERENRIIGVGRYYHPEDSDLAEAAFVVIDEWQGRGVGRFILSQLVLLAQKQGILGFEAYIQSDNLVVIDIIERSGYVLDIDDQGDSLYVWFPFDGQSLRCPSRKHLFL